MTLREQALKAGEDVPESKLPELIQFANFLRISLATFDNKENKPLRHGGWVKGEIFMSEDFNDPLDFVSEDEMSVLEAVRAQKNSKVHEELQEAAV